MKLFIVAFFALVVMASCDVSHLSKNYLAPVEQSYSDVKYQQPSYTSANSVGFSAPSNEYLPPVGFSAPTVQYLPPVQQTSSPLASFQQTYSSPPVQTISIPAAQSNSGGFHGGFSSGSVGTQYASNGGYVY